METTFQYMRFVPYSAIHNWSVQFMSGTNLFSSKYPIVQLGKYIKEENRRFDISDASSKYGILGVNNQTGIFDAYIESGANIKQKYKKMETGWIAFNPYRINVGSVGIKKECHSNDYISPAYVVFSCERPLMADFLYLVMRTKTYNAVIRKNTTGSVRQSLSFKTLKTLKIPMPILEEQRTLLGRYNSKISDAYEVLQLVETIKVDWMLHVRTRLFSKNDFGTDTPRNSILQFVQNKDVVEWGPSMIFKRALHEFESP